MKKLLSILMLLVAIVTGAWADATTKTYTFDDNVALDTDWDVVKDIPSGASATCEITNNLTTSFSPKDGKYLGLAYLNKSNVGITVTTKATYSNISQISIDAVANDNGKPTFAAYIVTSTGDVEVFAAVGSKDGFGTGGTNKWGNKTVALTTPVSGKLKIVTVAASSGKYAALDNIKITYTETPATAYTVSFNAGDHGTYTGGDIPEESAGAGITLPALTSLADGYIFNGWFTAATGGDKAGNAGETYKPTDDVTVYAQYSEIPTPTFVLSETSIEVGQTAQIKVTGKDDLDGVTLTDLTYDDTKISIDANGVVTPSVAGGPYAISFNSSAVAGKYNASTGNELSITVTAPKCATPTISPVSFSTDNQKVTITSETADATIYYTTDGTDPTESSNVYDSEDKPTISSTTTFKAIAVKENYDDSEVATQKVTRTSSAVVANWNFTNWSSETQAGVRTDNTNWRDYEDSTDKKPLNDKVYSNKVANATFVYSETTIPETKGLSFATTAYTFGLAFDQASTTIGTYHGSEYLWLYGSNSTITIPSLTAGQTIEIGFESHKTSEERTLTITNINESNPKATEYKVQTVTVKNDGNVTITPSKGMHIYYIKVTSNVETVPVSTVGSNNYATYVTESNLDFTGVEGITAYIATGDNGSTITTEAVTKVPAGTALLIKTAEPGATVNVPVAASTPATLTANKLKFLTSPLLISSIDETVKRYYGFFKVGKKYGFAPMKEGILAAKKAYLDYGSGNSLEFIALDLEDAPTAINFVEAENNANSAAPIKVIKNGKLYIGNYNVAGQQVK